MNKLLIFYPAMIFFWVVCLVFDLIFLPFTGMRIAWPICIAYYATRWNEVKDLGARPDE
jgi:hypothetical protein